VIWSLGFSMKLSTHDFWLHESLASDGNKNFLDSLKVAGGLLQ